MVIKERLNRLIEAKGMTLNSFSKAIGIGQSTMQNYVKYDRVPSYEALIAILDTFPDVSAEWLMRGQGSMYIADSFPPFVGNESDTEENVHAAYIRCRIELEEEKKENARLLSQLEFMEGYNVKVAGWLNEARKKIGDISEKIKEK